MIGLCAGIALVNGIGFAILASQSYKAADVIPGYKTIIRPSAYVTCSVIKRFDLKSKLINF